MASAERASIDRWWQRWPVANVAVRTGAVSGLVVVDVDPGHGGDATLAELLERHGPLPAGALVHTGSGGRHLYFAHPGGVVRNDTGRRLGPGLDVRGDGGYVIAPPSRHVTGTGYRWDGPDRSLAALPDWLIGRLREPVRPKAPQPATAFLPQPGRVAAWARAALERELAAVASACEGSRNQTLNRAAFSLGQIVGGGGLDPDEVTGLLLERAAASGLGAREAETTVASGLSAGVRHPRYPAAKTIDLRTIPLPGTPSSARAALPAPAVPVVDLPAPL